jgi:hypothetical protein
MLMKRWIICVTFVLLSAMLLVPSSPLVGPSHAQQIAGPGLDQIVCVLGVDGSGTYSRGELIITIEDNFNGHPGTARVTIQHGTTSSTHFLTYDDANSNGRLDCGDHITSAS